jgi:hypothetical protein
MGYILTLLRSSPLDRTAEVAFVPQERSIGMAKGTALFVRGSVQGVLLSRAGAFYEYRKLPSAATPTRIESSF